MSKSYSEVSIEDITFNNPQKYGDNKVVRKGYSHLCTLGKDLGVLNLPELKLYSSGVYKEDDLSYIDLLLGRSDKSLYVFLNELDTHVLQTVQGHSSDWYGEEVSLDVLKTYYTNTVRSKDKLPLLQVLVEDGVSVLNADGDVLDVNSLSKNMKLTVSLEMEGLRIEEDSMNLSLVVKSIQTATRSKSTTAQETTETQEQSNTTTSETPETVVDDTVNETVEVGAVTETATDANESTTENEDVNEDVKVEKNIENVVEPVEDVVVSDTASVSSVKSTHSTRSTRSTQSTRSNRSTRSRRSTRTAMSSQLSEQMELVKKMHRDAVRAEKYANKKKMAALKAVHELRNMELSEMASNYNSYNLDDDLSEFIETASYMDA